MFLNDEEKRMLDGQYGPGCSMAMSLLKRFGEAFDAEKMVKAGTGPGAIICIMAEPIIASAAITADIPMIDRIEKDLFNKIKTGDYLKVDATKGIIEISNKK
ncbi:MAG: DUF521 domain-containing protein [Deltaproteobacteria bacterium]|nr:DUF521 domain-containing protein [Deltaproteobacteria bacterium]